MPNLKHEEAALARAKTLIQAKRYEDAVKVLAPLKSEKARAWMGKLNSMGFEYEAPKPAKAKTGIEGVFRVVWGIATLLSCGWILFGITATGSVATNSVNEAVQGTPMVIDDTPVFENDDYVVTTMVASTIFSGLGTIFFICTGLPFFLLFLVLFWRAGIGIRSKRQHADHMNALRGL